MTGKSRSGRCSESRKGSVLARGVELAGPYTVGDDPFVANQPVHVGRDDVSGICGQLDIGREELGLVEGFAALAGDEEVEPAALTLGSGSLSGRSGFERFRDLREPALGDGVTERGFAWEVEVEAAVADAEGARLSASVQRGQVDAPVRRSPRGGADLPARI
jgi:hypothetical protein